VDQIRPVIAPLGPLVPKVQRDVEQVPTIGLVQIIALGVARLALRAFPFAILVRFINIKGDIFAERAISARERKFDFLGLDL